MKLIKFLFLYPVSLVYGAIINFRNFLFDTGVLKSKEFDIPVISVGNISAGGTGKTPTTEFLISFLKDKYKTAVLSRGYKRKTKGFILANENINVEETGDELFQIFKKFPDIIVAAAEKRVSGINELLNLPEKPELIILDDAFQHRYVKPTLSILVVDNTRPFLKDKYLPYGMLRDNPKERFRAEIVLVSKTSLKIKPIEMRIIASDLKLKPYQSLFFSGFVCEDPVSVYNKAKTVKKDDLRNYDVLAVSGIGNPKPFEDYFAEKTKSLKFLRFVDHKKYTEKDIEKILSEFDKIKSEKKIIITTEKDAVKIQNIKNERLKDFIYFCSIQTVILNQEEKLFKDKVLQFIEKTNAQYRFLTSEKRF